MNSQTVLLKFRDEPDYCVGCKEVDVDTTAKPQSGKLAVCLSGCLSDQLFAVLISTELQNCGIRCKVIENYGQGIANYEVVGIGHPFSPCKDSCI